VYAIGCADRTCTCSDTVRALREPFKLISRLHSGAAARFAE